MRLTEAELEQMRAKHAKWIRADAPDTCEWCIDMDEDDEPCGIPFPCDAARLLAHFAPGPVPHLAGIAAGLFGPITSDELAR